MKKQCVKYLKVRQIPIHKNTTEKEQPGKKKTAISTGRTMLEIHDGKAHNSNHSKRNRFRSVRSSVTSCVAVNPSQPTIATSVKVTPPGTLSVYATLDDRALIIPFPVSLWQLNNLSSRRRGIRNSTEPSSRKLGFKSRMTVLDISDATMRNSSRSGTLSKT